jgi:hypothetical protein
MKLKFRRKKSLRFFKEGIGGIYGLSSAKTKRQALAGLPDGSSGMSPANPRCAPAFAARTKGPQNEQKTLLGRNIKMGGE